MRLLVDEDEVLLARGGVAVPSNSTTGMLPMNWPRGAASSSAGKRSSEYAVPNALYSTSGVNTSSQRSVDELARVRHVPGAQRVEFDEVGGALRVVGQSAPQVRLESDTFPE